TTLSLSAPPASRHIGSMRSTGREVPKSAELPDEAARPTRDSPRPLAAFGKFVPPARELRVGIRGSCARRAHLEFTSGRGASGEARGVSVNQVSEPMKQPLSHSSQPHTFRPTGLPSRTTATLV